MNLIAKRIRGMQDLLPDKSKNWETLEKIMKEEAEVYGFKLIRTPVLEQTELFERSVGNESDIVEKEMYTFKDKGDRSVTLRPEGTAGALRAVLENGLNNGPMPLKLMYVSSCYRYEKPQSGRYREFFQFGLEVFGAPSPLADAELICLAKSILDRLTIKNLSLEINSIGCKECRKKYNEAIINYFNKNKENLCETCQKRLEKNPMRILDCKEKGCINISKNAPVILDYLCEDCEAHFSAVKCYLDVMNVKYAVNPKIVRGLDYYSKTVFEFVCELEGEKMTICGGGRYDGLSKIMGGPELSAIGLGMGIERILAVMEKQKIEFQKPESIQVFIANADEKSKEKAFELCEIMRKSSIIAECNICERNLKSQMKYANKINVQFVLIIGEEEIQTKKANLKDMASGKEIQISLEEDFIKDFLNAQFDFN
ncbi:MAG: histidine--tRNA ligase [Clostridia bacterium]|nr:histidine--tRNA ligase [Clostridia bacterium]